MIKLFTKPLAVVLLMLLCIPLWLSAAPAKKFSKKYRNTRLEVVLDDICKRYNYQLVADTNEIDLDKRITATFKQVSLGSVLRKVLDKDLTYKIRKRKIFITRKPLPSEVHTSVAITPSSVEENDSLRLTIWKDTIYSITCRTITKEVAAKPSEVNRSAGQKEVSYKGHHLWGVVGGAYADMNYLLRDAGNNRVGDVRGSLGAIAQLQYAYFFHENWGVSAGVGFSHYTSYGTLNHTIYYPGRTDTDGERYTHLALMHDWKERQTAYMLDVPVEMLFHYPLRADLGLYVGVGVKMGLIMAADYRLKSGALEHRGEYEQWGLTLTDMSNHGFTTAYIGSDFSTDKQSLSLKIPSVGLMADVGVTIKLTEQLNLTTGLFCHYTCNNVRPVETTEIDWLNNQYSGLIASEYVRAVRPWELGIKVGIDWRYKEKSKKISSEVQYVRIQKCDTTITFQQRVDTVYKTKPTAVREIVRIMETSVIWFDLDSYKPKLQPADILDKIAAILIENPRQKIQIHGHASKEGVAVHNQRLSEQRAKVIYEMLLQKGVRAEQMSTHAFGVDKAYQEGEHEISLDRRVEIIPVNE